MSDYEPTEDELNAFLAEHGWNIHEMARAFLKATHVEPEKAKAAKKK